MINTRNMSPAHPRGGVYPPRKPCYRRGGCTPHALKLAAAAAAGGGGGSPNPSLTKGLQPQRGGGRPPPQLCTNCCRGLGHPSHGQEIPETIRSKMLLWPASAGWWGLLVRIERLNLQLQFEHPSALISNKTCGGKPQIHTLTAAAAGRGVPTLPKKTLLEQPRLGEPISKEKRRTPGDIDQLIHSLGRKNCLSIPESCF